MDPQITNNKPEKIKDPKRVAQGKKLALISREAKERKKLERDNQDNQNEESTVSDDNYESASTGSTCAIGLVGVSAVLAYFWYQKSVVKPEQTEQPEPSNETPKQNKKATNMIESFD